MSDLKTEVLEIKQLYTPKGAFLLELVEARNRWEVAKEPEYVAAYERMIAAYTMPGEESK